MSKNNQPSKYCSIARYLQRTDIDLYDIFQDLCVAGKLQATSRTTLLLPVGKLRDQLIKETYEGNIDTATIMANSLIIQRLDLSTPDAWKSATKIMNGNRQFYSAKIVNNKISIDGVELKQHKKFVPRDSTLSIWEIDSIPKASDESQKSGSYDPSDNLAKSFRYKLGLYVENKYAQKKKEMLTAHKVGSYLSFDAMENCKCVYLQKSISILYYLHEKHPDLFFSKALPVISFQPIDFYILVEPHTEPGSNFLLPEDVLLDWYKNIPQVSTKDAYKKLLEVLSNPPEEYRKYGCYKEHIVVASQANSIRHNIADLQPSVAVKEIYKVYDQLDEHNIIGDLDNVYPPELHEYYKSNPGLKMVHDELRYTTTLRFDRILNSLSADLTDYKNLINYIAETLHANTKDVRRAQLILLNPITLTAMNAQFGKDFNIFLRSTYFLYMPVKLEDIKNYPIHLAKGEKPDNGDDYIWNIDAAKLSQHERIIPGFKVDELLI